MHAVHPAAPVAEPLARPAAAVLNWRVPLAVAAVAVLARLVPAVLTYGTSDVMTWELLGRLLLNGENFYATQLHNWPPLWIYFTAAAVLASDASGLPFATLVKLPPIAADACIAVLLVRFAVRPGQNPRAPIIAGLAYALNPVSILITGYHGQFDSLMLAATFLAWCLWEWRWSLGMGMTASQTPHVPQHQSLECAATPGVTPQAPAHLTPDVSPHVTPRAPAHLTPDVSHDVTPQAPAHLTPDGAPHATPQAPAHLTPNMTAHVTPGVTPQVTPQVRPSTAPNLIPHVKPHVTVCVTPASYTQGRRWGVVGPERARASANRHLIAGGVALGVGIWFKPVALLLLPVLLPRLGSWRDRVVYTALAITPSALGTLPFLVLWPQDVATNFLGYSSWFGQWGYPVVWMVVEYIRNGTLPWWLPDPAHVSLPLRIIADAGKWVLLSSLIATWWFTYRSRKTVLTSILATFAVFYVATSGFGVQYLLWIVPFAIAARDRWLWPFSIAATCLLVVVYTLGAAYQPLSITPDNAPSQREFIVKLASLPTWLICGAWTWSLLRRNS